MLLARRRPTDRLRPFATLHALSRGFGGLPSGIAEAAYFAPRLGGACIAAFVLAETIFRPPSLRSRRQAD